LFIDFISYLTYLEGEEPLTDYIILNSVTMVNKAVNIIEDRRYTDIDLFLDNDEAGDIAVDQLQELLAVDLNDKRGEYKSFKDFNDFLISKHKNINT